MAVDARSASFIGQRDKNIETREARTKLKPSGKPYWRIIGKGLHVGYRKGKRGGAWVIRRYLGDQDYKVETIAAADDVEDANGIEILDFWQAQEAARNMRPGTAPNVKGYTVSQAVAEYLEHLEGRASWHDAKKRLEAFVLPAFGDKAVIRLMKTKSANGIETFPSRARGRGQSRGRRRTTARAKAIRKLPASARHRRIAA